MTSSTSTVVQEIEAALQAAETALPTILSIVGIFFPAAKALVPFLPLLPELLKALEIVVQATGGDLASAMKELENHLTPGAPNSPALAPNNANQGS